MNARKFSDAMSELDTKYVDEALNYKKKAKKPSWIKWGAVAACLVLIIGGTFIFRQTHTGTEVISFYDSNSDGSYVVPNNGQLMYEVAVMEARDEYYGKDVTFLLAFNLFENGETISSEKREEEYQRLISDGYKLYFAECWTYQGKGEKKYYTKVVGCFTEEELANFKSNPSYGYFFYFAKNGDSSPISVNQDNLITEYTTNHS